jgi:hypothetical protein
VGVRARAAAERSRERRRAEIMMRLSIRLPG